MPKNRLMADKEGGDQVKATGVVRKVDQLGRVVLRASLRREFSLDIVDGVEIFSTDESIVLRKYEPACVFCGQTQAVTLFLNRRVCRQCREGLARQPA